MSLRAFIRARKTVTDPGAWSDKRMPKTGGKFPLTKARSFRVGSVGWRWRVAHIRAASTDYRLLVTYHASKVQFLAVLGIDLGYDTLVLGRLEWHATHKGWHMHGCCVQADKQNSGRLNYPDMVRVPGPRNKHRLTNQSLSDRTAIETAMRYFRIRGLEDDNPEQPDMWP